MRAIVTGAGGFVGANLVRRLLEDGHETVACVRPGGDRWRLEGLECEIAELDLTQREAVRAVVGGARPAWVFHVAAHGAYSWQTDAARILETNLAGTVNLLGAVLELGFEAFVHAGSSSEYGFKDHAPPESELPEPNSDYAVMKAAATMYCGFVGRTHGLRVSTLRLYSVYGPYEEPNRLIPQLLVHALRGELPPLASPEIARDFVFSEDVCDAFLAAAASPDIESGGVYNVGSGTQTTLREVVDVAISEFGVEREPDWGSMEDRRWDTSIWMAEASKARAELGWEARTELRDGLARTADWLRSSPNLLPRYLGG